MLNAACYNYARVFFIDINLWSYIILFSCLDDLGYVYMEKGERFKDIVNGKIACSYIFVSL